MSFLIRLLSFFRTAQSLCEHGLPASDDCPDCMRAREALVADRVRRQNATRLRQVERLGQIEYLCTMDALAFEDLVLHMFEVLGWQVKATSRVADGGIDGLMLRNGNLFILQCKRLKDTKVGTPVLRDLLGTVVGENAKGGILVTSSSFSRPAKDWVKDKPLELVDGARLLTDLKHALEQSDRLPKSVYRLGLIEDSLERPCPECSSPLALRIGRYGPFIGCSAYPKCRHTERVPGGR